MVMLLRVLVVLLLVAVTFGKSTKATVLMEAMDTRNRQASLRAHLLQSKCEPATCPCRRRLPLDGVRPLRTPVAHL